MMGLNEQGYKAMPRVEQTLPSYLSPSVALSLRALALPSKPLHTTFSLVGKWYTAAGQAGVCFHTTAVLQAYQADLLKELDEGEEVKADDITELRRTADLSLHATKETTCATSRCMAVVDRFQEARKQAVAFQRYLPCWSVASGAAGQE